MKLKIVEADYGLFYVMVKLNWYSKWKVIDYNNHQFKTYKSVNDYWKDYDTTFNDTYQKADELLKKYKNNYGI